MERVLESTVIVIATTDLVSVLSGEANDTELWLRRITVGVVPNE